MVVGVMQISSLQRKFDQERKSLNSQVHDLERKLDVLRQELVVAESTLSAKDSELAVLKNNLKELEDLREMKEVLILYIYRFTY
jgi:septal ring factor EnvC (AmiA/AmiB activator)